MGFRRPVTIERTSMGTIDENGRYQKGTTGTLTIQASVQPLSIREQSTIVGPDGARNVSYVKIYTNIPLIPQSAAKGQGKPTMADIVQYLGRRFLVIQCDAYQSGVISYYRAYAKEVLADDDT